MPNNLFEQKQFVLTERLIEIGLMHKEEDGLKYNPGFSPAAIAQATVGLMQGKVLMVSRNKNGGEIVDLSVLAP